MVGGWKSDSWSVVLLDKYREKQRHGGSNENENKGALRNYDSDPVCSRATRENRDTFLTHAARTELSRRGKNRQNKVNDVKERDRRERSCSCLDFLNRTSDSRNQSLEINQHTTNVYNIFILIL